MTEHIPLAMQARLGREAPQQEATEPLAVSETLASQPVGGPPPEPANPLSSAMIDGLLNKQRRGEPWTRSECGELLDAYQSLMEAYHDVGSLSQGAPEPPRTADEYLGTLGWPDDKQSQAVREAVETHIRYFARWLHFARDVDQSAAVSRGPAPTAAPPIYNGESLCAHRFDKTICVAPAGHDGPHVTSNAAFPHGLIVPSLTRLDP